MEHFKKFHKVNFNKSSVIKRQKESFARRLPRVVKFMVRPRDAVQEEGDTTMLKDARVYGLHCNLHRALALENAARYRVTRAGNVRRAHVRSRRIRTGEIRREGCRRLVQSLFGIHSCSIHFRMNHLLSRHIYVLCYLLIIFECVARVLEIH